MYYACILLLSMYVFFASNILVMNLLCFTNNNHFDLLNFMAILPKCVWYKSIHIDPQLIFKLGRIFYRDVQI